MRRSPMPRRRRPMRGVSAERLARRAAAQPAVDAVLERDGGCVLRDDPETAGRCSGRITPHHLRKAWKRWDWTLDNLVGLCVAHQTWVEDHPVEARIAGLVIVEGDDYLDAWTRMVLCDLPVGLIVEVCPGSLLPPLSEADGHGACTCCRACPTLANEPSGGPGPVVESHSWVAPVGR